MSAEWIISVFIMAVMLNVAYWIGKRRGRAESNYRELEY